MLCGRLDSGADTIFLKESTCHKLNLPLSYNSNTTTIEFGNGTTTTSIATAHLNENLSALIVSDINLVEDLISINPIMDLGYHIVLSKTGGWILTNEKQRVLPIARHDSKWIIDIEKLRTLSSSKNKNTNCMSATKINENIMSLHERMGHPPINVMFEALDKGSWLSTDVTSADLRSIHDLTCIPCIMGKRNKTPIARQLTNPKDVPIGHLISGDIVGPITPASFNGDKYFYIFVDRRTSHLHVFTSKTKDGFITSLKSVYSYYVSKGFEVKGFRSDSENIMVYGDVQKFLDDNHIDHTLSLPYAHFQNLVERHVQTVVKGVTTLMHSQHFLNASFWNYALFHYVSLKNDTPNVKTNGLTPRFMIEGGTPVDLSRKYCLPFGSPCVSTNPARTWRFDTRRDIGIYVGHPSGSVNGAMVYFPYDGSIANRHDVIGLTVTKDQFNKYIGSKSVLQGDTLDINELNLPIADQPEENNPSESVVETPNETNVHTTSPEPLIKGDLSRRKIKTFLKKLGVSTRSMIKHSAMIAKTIKGKKNDLTEALEGEDRNQWVKALSDEINSLLNVTQAIVPETPDTTKDYDIIYATTVMKKKLHADGSIDKFKVRIPVCGNQLLHKPGYDNYTYSPTVSTLTNISLMQLVIYDKMNTAIFDTIGAYLHQPYPDSLKPLYLKFPKHLAFACGLDPNQLYRIKKYLYGLPDAGFAYYHAYSKALENGGYIKSKSDPCLFIRIDKNIRTYCWIHVDDSFVASTHPEEIQRFKEMISTTYPITVDYNVTSHLGIGLIYNDDGSVTLNQSKLLQQIFAEHPQLQTKSKYPMLTKFNTQTRNEEEENEIKNEVIDKYGRLLGQLNYLPISRPDITTSVSYSATKSKNPRPEDFEALLQIVSYLKQTEDYGLTLYPRNPEENDNLYLTAYVDAAYMSHPDSSSHTGFCISLGSMHPRSYFYTKSSKQKCIATSSTHAEIKALYELTINIIYLLTLFDEIGRPIQLPVKVYEDNRSTLDLVSSPTIKITKSKHYLMLIQYVREQVKQGLIQVEKVGGDENIANVLTKIICTPEFFKSITSIMGLQQ